MLAGGQGGEAHGAFRFLGKYWRAGAGDLSGDNKGDKACRCNARLKCKKNVNNPISEVKYNQDKYAFYSV